MSHIFHISKNKQHIIMRSHIVRLIREFFWDQNFLEVETPHILKTAGQEPNIQAMHITIHNEHHEPFYGYLHTYPEYAMKKLLAAGFGNNIFSICKSFRDHESFGGTHNPEFTMIEWYRLDHDFFALMDDMERMFQYIAQGLKIKNFDVPSSLEKLWKRTHMRDLWREYVGIELDNYLDVSSMYELCVEKGFRPNKEESYEELFYRIFLDAIEPNLGVDEPQIIYYYPALMASLSKRSTKEPGYAERFESYIDGVEIANGFTELTDAQEQLERLKEDKNERARLGLDDYEIDKDFVEAVEHLPACTGNSMGLDRIVQAFAGCKNINDVLALPASEIFQS